MKVGLALGSGSARGWSHVGVIKALEKQGIQPDIICGTSVGALIAAAHITKNLEALEGWVKSLTRYQMARFFEINSSFSGFVDVKKLFEFFYKYIADKDQQIEDLSATFACVATQLQTGREVWFTKGNLLQAIHASMAMPGLFPPVELEGNWVVDGGLVNPVPVSLCRALGAEVVIAVNLNGDLVQPVVINKPKKNQPKKSHYTFTKFINNYTPSFLKKEPKEKSSVPSVFNAIASSVNIAQDRITKSRMAGDPPDILLAPKLGKIGLLDFYMATEAIDEGEKCVERMSEQIKNILGHENERNR